MSKKQINFDFNLFSMKKNKSLKIVKAKVYQVILI